MPIELTEKYLRVRLKPPEQFSRIRTHDTGRAKHSKRIAGYNPKTRKWETQSWLVNRKDLKAKDTKTMTLMFHILPEVPYKDRTSLQRTLKRIM